jgi:hypothetical protein
LTSPRHPNHPAQTEDLSQNPDSLEVAPGRERETIEGWLPELATEEELREALEKAFDYRGDVTLTTKDGKKLEGYIFDRVSGPTLAASFVRLLPKDSSQRQKISSPIFRRSLSPAAIPPPERVGKHGSASTGKRKPRARAV